MSDDREVVFHFQSFDFGSYDLRSFLSAQFWPHLSSFIRRDASIEYKHHLNHHHNKTGHTAHFPVQRANQPPLRCPLSAHLSLLTMHLSSHWHRLKASPATTTTASSSAQPHQRPAFISRRRTSTHQPQPNRRRHVCRSGSMQSDSTSSTAQLDALVQDGIVWASQHGLVGVRCPWGVNSQMRVVVCPASVLACTRAVHTQHATL